MSHCVWSILVHLSWCFCTGKLRKMCCLCFHVCPHVMVQEPVSRLSSYLGVLHDFVSTFHCLLLVAAFNWHTFHEKLIFFPAGILSVTCYVLIRTRNNSDKLIKRNKIHILCTMPVFHGMCAFKVNNFEIFIFFNSTYLENITKWTCQIITQCLYFLNCSLFCRTGARIYIIGSNWPVVV